jgi:hypothetical protein
VCFIAVSQQLVTVPVARGDGNVMKMSWRDLLSELARKDGGTESRSYLTGRTRLNTDDHTSLLSQLTLLLLSRDEKQTIVVK